MRVAAASIQDRLLPRPLASLAALVLSVLMPALSSWASAEISARTQAILGDVRTFEALGTRITGSPGADRALDLIQRRFESLGLQNITRQPFDVVVPVTRHVSLRIDGIDLPASPLLPNWVRTPTIDGTLTGPLLWSGSGSLDTFNGRGVNGSIVVLKGDLGVDWFHAPLLGARAVIFVESSSATRPQMEYKYGSVPIPTPRFWVDEATGEWIRLRLQKAADPEQELQAELECRVDWETRTGTNLFGLLPGSDPAQANNVMMVQAYYDAASTVPDLAPGAENAVNISLLLRIAQEFRETRPARPVLFAAFSGHYQALQGARAFADLWSHTSFDRAAGVDKREESVKAIARLRADVDEVVPSYRILLSELETLRRIAPQFPEQVVASARRLEPDLLREKSQMPVLREIRKELSRLREDARVESETKPRDERDLPLQVYGEAGRVRDYLELVEVREVRATKARYKLFRLQEHLRVADEMGGNLLQKVRFVFGLDLSSHSERVGMFFKAHFINQFERWYETPLRQTVSPLAYLATELADSLSTLLGVKHDGNTIIDGVNNPGGLNWETHLAVPLGVDMEMTTLAGLPGTAFISTGDPRIWVDTPLDQASRIDAGRLDNQISLFVPLLRELLSNPEALRLYDDVDEEALLRRDRARRVHGRAVYYEPTKSLGDVADQPVPGALMAIARSPLHHARQRVYKSYGGVRPMDMTFADEGGFYEFIGLSDRQAGGYHMRTFKLEGYVLDRPTGRIVFAPDLADFSAKPFKAEQSLFELNKEYAEYEKNPVLFECVPLTVFDMMDQRSFSTFASLEVYDAKSGSTPMAWGHKLVGTVSGKTYVEPAGTMFIPPHMRFKAQFAKLENARMTGGTPVAGTKFPLLNVSLDPGAPPDGTGYDVSEGGVLPLTPLLMAEDTWRLDELRLNGLKKHGIRSAHVENLHNAAGVALAQAREALGEQRYDAFLRHARAAWSYEAKAYPYVQGTLIDVLSGVILYLFLLLPFASFTERLLFGFTGINAQIAGFFGIFLVAFFVLSQVHPAFAITNAAPIILLAFITLTLSIMVISMIRSRFQVEIQRLQQRPGSSARADFSRLDAAKTAFILGINNMRRRKIRTGLTITTLVLLMFSVLSLSSIESQLLIQRRAVSDNEAPLYEGVLIRNRSWGDMSAPTYTHLVNAFPRDEGHLLAPRNWIVSADANVPTGVLLSNADDPSRTFRLTGLVGMTETETAITRPAELLAVGRWLRDGEKEVCVISQKIAGLLGIAWDGRAPNPEVVVYGRRLRVVGIFDDAKLLRWSDIDTELLSPVDYSVENWQRHSGTDHTTDTEFYHYTHLDSRNVLFAPFELLLDHGATLKSIVLIPGSREGSLKDTVERDILKKLDIPVFIAEENRVTYAASTKGNVFSGIAVLFIPMFISALIVLNTMMGSVFEREREISIYGAMGLAPVHISSLFMAESCVYATISTVTGYIIGQVVAKVITMQGLLEGLSLNYSSISAVFAAVFIVVVVLLSTLYPARRAAALSVPDVERIWKLPKPEGDLMDIEFPFTINEKDILGINAYLLFYFRDHSRQSVGEFFTAENLLTEIDTPLGMGYRLSSSIWIAPFDFGISQTLEMETSPTEDPKVYQTRMKLVRVSGDNEAWAKMNNRFLKHIRKQFLLWRLLTAEEREYYKAEAEKALAAGETALAG